MTKNVDNSAAKARYRGIEAEDVHERYADEVEFEAKRELVQEVEAEDVTNAMLRADRNRPDSWLVYNKGFEQLGYAPTFRVTPDSVGDLEKQWEFTVETPNLQTTPIIVPDDPPTMYFAEGNYTVYAANARTGDTYWTTQPEFEVSPVDMGGGLRTRGVAVMQDKVFLATGLPELIALDRYSGEVVWRTEAMTEEQREAMLPEAQQRVYITQMPLAYDGLVFTGQSSDANGWTAVQAYDAETGERVWHSTTAPPDEWVEETYRFASNAAWMTPALDTQTEQVIWSVGNPDPMHNGVVRPGPNRLSNALVAWDMHSGEVNWVQQQLPHDLWDYDTHTTPYILDMRVGGEERRVVAMDHKMAWTYIVDIETGQLVERTRPWAGQGGDFLEMPARGEENKEDNLAWPEGSGATEWPRDAFSPHTGYRYIGGNNSPQWFWYDPDWAYEAENYDGVGGGHDPVPPGEEGAPNNETFVSAVDLETGEVAWQTPHEDFDEDDQTVAGGNTVTAGGVLYNVNSVGTLIAFDAESGEKLRELTETNGIGRIMAPIVWDDPAAGMEFVAVNSDDTIHVFAASG